MLTDIQIRARAKGKCGRINLKDVILTTAECFNKAIDDEKDN
jgi:hypothetical protein